MNCIYCGMVICIIPGDSFTPHFKKDGIFKCRSCGPITKDDLMVYPFAMPRNAIVSDIDGNYRMFVNGKWHFVDENGISDYARGGALKQTDNLAPYTIQYERAM